MEQTPFIEPQLGPPAPKRSHKKLIIILTVIVVALAVIGIIAAVLLASGGKKEAQKQEVEKPAVSKEFKITNAAQPLTYAGHKVYDACSLISYETIRKTVEGYQPLLDTIGTNEYPSDPLAIVHNYVDRDIPAPLGKDGQPHQTSKAIGGSSGKLSASNFVGGSDSSCIYGQGEGLEIGRGQTFAKVYVNQLPTPISAEFLAYINSLTKTVSEAGIDIYVEPERDSGGFATAIFITADKKTVVVLKFGPEKLAAPLGDDMVKFLSAGPVGPMQVEYPKPWEGLKNPCKLISATEFEQFTGKPADTFAEDIATLTQVEEGWVMKRSCERIEVERLDRSEISSAKVTVRMAKSVDSAKGYVTNKGKKADGDRVLITDVNQPIDGADEAYVRTNKLLDKVRDYEFEMRVGQAILTVNVEGEAGLDASVEAFMERMTPVAKTVVANWKK